MKKFIAVLLTVILMVLTVPVYAEYEPSPTDIFISGYSVDPTGTINPGNDFVLTLNLEKKAEATEIEDLFITINNPATFIPVNSGSKIPVSEKWNSNKLSVTGIKLKYTGKTSESLSLTISATINGKEFDSTDYVFINISTSDNSGGDSTPPDLTKYVPTLHVDNAKMPVAIAGKTFKLALTINNTSAYTAEDVTITPTYTGEGNDPFLYNTIKQSGYIDRISARTSKDVIFNYTIAPNTPAGIYALALNYTFYNSFGGSPEFKATETIRVKIENNNAAPSLYVNKITYPEAGLQAGATVPVKLSLSNKGSTAAKDVVVTLKGLETGKFTIEGNGNRATVASVYKGLDEQATFNIRVGGSMAAGSYDLSALIEYKDDAGNAYSQESQFFLPVSTGDPDASGLQIQNVSVSNKAYQIDENIPVSFNLVNSGTSKLYGVEVSLAADEAILPRTQARQSLGIMEPGKSKSLEFIFFAKKEAITRNYPIGIEVSYKTGPDSEPIKLLQYVGVYVENENKDGSGAGSKSVPKIIIDSYSTDPVIVRAGSNFNLKISFHNTNSEKTVSNIKVSFTAPSETEKGSVFTPVNSSNTFYIESIAPRDSIEMERVFYTIPDAPPKTYTIVANFEYEYDGLDGPPVTAQEQIGIPVVQQTRLETSMINMQPTSYMGQPIPLNFEFYNMGKVTLSNLMITVEGDFTSSTPNYFVGNFEPGLSDYFDTMLTPNATGQLTGTIVFAYDDAAGEHQEVRKEFSTTVEEMPAEAYNPEFPGGVPGEMPPDGMPGQQPTGIMKIVKSPITWVVGGVIILGIAALIIVKKIKKRKELTLDE